MNNKIIKAWTYSTISFSLVGFSFLPGVWNPTSIRVLGFAFFLGAITLYFSTKFTWGWLVRTTKFLESIPVTPLAIFLPLYGFSLALINAQYVFLGYSVVLVAYGIFGLMIGRHSGKSLRQIFNRLNIFQPSPKIPKDL